MKKILFLLSFLLLTQNSFAFEITNKNINDLKFGKTNPTIKQLQIFLNKNGFYESEQGPGSPSNETEYYGNTTVASVKVFQKHSKLPITGKVDFATGRAINKYLNEMAAKESEYKSADYFADGQEGYLIEEEQSYFSEEEQSYFSEEDVNSSKSVIKTVSEEYDMNNKLDTYTEDVTDSYLNSGNTKPSNKSVTTAISPTKKKMSLKELLEGSSKRTSPSSSEKLSNFFQRFFSMFE